LRRQRHVYGYVLLLLRCRIKTYPVNQSQIHNVYRNFRIVTLLLKALRDLVLGNSSHSFLLEISTRKTLEVLLNILHLQEGSRQATKDLTKQIGLARSEKL